MESRWKGVNTTDRLGIKMTSYSEVKKILSTVEEIGKKYGLYQNKHPHNGPEPVVLDFPSDYLWRPFEKI